MVDMGSIVAAIKGLQAAGDIAKAMLELRETSAIQGKVIQLQSAILSAQQSAITAQSDQFSLLEQVRGLEAELAKAKDWEHQKQRYALDSPFTGSALYALKKEMSNGEPAHYLCSVCFENGKRSIMQNAELSSKWTSFKCPVCKCTVETGFRGNVSARFAGERA